MTAERHGFITWKETKPPRLRPHHLPSRRHFPSYLCEGICTEQGTTSCHLLRDRRLLFSLSFFFFFSFFAATPPPLSTSSSLFFLARCRRAGGGDGVRLRRSRRLPPSGLRRRSSRLRCDRNGDRDRDRETELLEWRRRRWRLPLRRRLDWRLRWRSSGLREAWRRLRCRELLLFEWRRLWRSSSARSAPLPAAATADEPPPPPPPPSSSTESAPPEERRRRREGSTKANRRADTRAPQRERGRARGANFPKISMPNVHLKEKAALRQISHTQALVADNKQLTNIHSCFELS